ncbi:hypothetical protein CBR_g10961 [Chara braunii]|uniref:NAD-dependent epimerase/dehydratase domain-containing protein n=1 Tax=Chara braunii TaxID=69332 RepID=A0A388KPR1_CHABU|nr:hypothetical protein CBR_g10961 [Chara braunii]|eukprot:GBG72025.1 hypothetical protein CBR_g10961 [Chara braunii]
MAAMAAVTGKSMWPGLSARVAGDKAGNGLFCIVDSNIAVSVRRRRCDAVASCPDPVKIKRSWRFCRDADVSARTRKCQIGCSSRAMAQRQCWDNLSASSASSSSSSSSSSAAASCSSSSCSYAGAEMVGRSFSSVRGSKCVAGTCSAAASFGAKCRIMGAVLAGTSCLPVTKFDAKGRTIAAAGKMRAIACKSEGKDAAERETSTKNTVLVTGGAGFIGSHVAAALLSRGDQVVVVDELNDAYDPKRKEANLQCLAEIAQKSGGDDLCVVKADVADRAEMERLFDSQAIDMVCHLAARAGVRASLSYPDKYVRANVEGTTILLDRAAKSRCSNFVYASSSSVYGDRPRLKDLSAASMPTDQGPVPGSGPGTGPGTGSGTGPGTGTGLRTGSGPGLGTRTGTGLEPGLGTGLEPGRGTPLIFERFREHLSFKESDVADSPRSPYAATKRSAEMMARIYHDVYGLHTTGSLPTMEGPIPQPVAGSAFRAWAYRDVNYDVHFYSLESKSPSDFEMRQVSDQDYRDADGLRWSLDELLHLLYIKQQEIDSLQRALADQQRLHDEQLVFLLQKVRMSHEEVVQVLGGKQFAKKVTAASRGLSRFAPKNKSSVAEVQAALKFAVTEPQALCAIEVLYSLLMAARREFEEFVAATSVQQTAAATYDITIQQASVLQRLRFTLGRLLLAAADGDARRPVNVILPEMLQKSRKKLQIECGTLQLRLASQTTGCCPFCGYTLSGPAAGLSSSTVGLSVPPEPFEKASGPPGEDDMLIS